MKKTSFILAFCFILAGSAFAGETVDHPWYLGLGTGADIPGSNWNSIYYVGSITHLFAGYEADPTWSLQADVQQALFNGGGNNLYNLRGLIEIKYTYDQKGWQPYALAGSGVAYQGIAPVTASTVNFDALVGLGVQVDLGSRIHAFLQADYNLILSQSNSYGDVPLSAGLWVGL